MSNHDPAALARLAITLPGWRWLAGMSTLYSGRLVAGGFLVTVRADEGGLYPAVGGGVDEVGTDLPAIDDPATWGALLSLLGDKADRCLPGSALHPDLSGWYWYDGAEWKGDEADLSPGAAAISLANCLGEWPGGRLDV